MRISLLITSLLLSVLFLQCGSNLDLTGRGAKTGCFFLDTDSMKIIYNCDERNIISITVRVKKNKHDTTEQLLFRSEPGFSAKEFVLPVTHDSLQEHFIEIELHLSDSHFRETYYISVKPGDLSPGKKIYARYYGH